MQRINFRTRNQLKRNVYIYIVLFFLVFLVVFLLLANLDRIVAQYNRASEHSQELRIQAIFERLRSEGTDSAINADTTTGVVPVSETEGICEVSLLGTDPICKLLKSHLNMLKQPWKQITAGGEASGLIIVAESQVSQDTMNWLLEQNDAGVHLLFISMPPREVLEQEEMRARLGIATVGEKITYPGMRTSKEMMLGNILEYDGSDEEEGSLDVEAYDIILTQQIKVFAHALTEDHLERGVTELPPLFWRCAPGGGKGDVYVCNGNFLSDETVYALLPTVLGDIRGSYIYPIVNAYCTMVDGFPYAENEEREMWREFYSRDGFGIQRELLLPEWERIENIYGTALTYFSPACEEIQTEAGEEMSFYHTEFQRGSAELAGKSGNVFYLYAPDEPLRVAPIEPGFSFESNGTLQLPYLGGDWLSTKQSLFPTAGLARGLGYVGLCIDVPELLEIGEKVGLPKFFEQIESLLGYQSTLYPWLERTTAQEAVERIDTYMNLQPAYTYHELGMTVELGHFEREAWFLLKTYGKDPEIDNGTIEKIGENTYLVEITAPVAEITWSREEE